MALIYFVTNRCNASCKHCFYWDNLNKNYSHELTVPEIDKIAAGVGRLAYLRLSGGEPFLRKDLFEMIERFVEHCSPMYVGIPTNGFYTKRVLAFAERAAQLDTRINIGLSIDALGAEHDRIRVSENAFENAMETFKGLKKLQKTCSNLTLGFITTAIKSNQNGLLELFEYLAALEPDSISCNIVRDDTKAKDEKEIDLTLSHQFNALCDEYNGANKVQRQDLFSRLRQSKTLLAHDIREKVLAENSYQIPCVAGDKMVVLYPEGEVYPCETLEEPLGNVRDFNYNLHELLSNDVATKVQKTIIDEQCHCTHECFISASVTFSKRQMARVVLATINPIAAK